MEDDVDVEGEDEAVFGAAQFTEEDILALNADNSQQPGASGNIEVDIEADDAPDESLNGNKETETLRGLVAQSEVVKRQMTEVMQVKRLTEEVIGVREAHEIERAVRGAREKGDPAALIAALESKVKFLVS